MIEIELSARGRIEYRSDLKYFVKEPYSINADGTIDVVVDFGDYRFTLKLSHKCFNLEQEDYLVECII